MNCVKSFGVVMMLIILGRVSETPAAIPGADNSNAYTQREYVKDFLSFNLRTTTEVYKQSGKHSSKWDAASIALMEGMSRRLTNSQDTPLNAISDVPSLEEMEKLGRQAIAAGCDDPIVIDMFCIALGDQGKVEEMIPLLRKTIDALSKSNYPVYRAAGAARRAIRFTDVHEADQKKKHEEQLYNFDLAAVKEAEKLGNDRRFYFRAISEDINGWPVDKQQKFAADLATAHGDPWLTNALAGVCHIKIAWGARGGGTASNVTEGGFKSFAEELNIAHECLEKAYKLEPKYPEAATEMITVAMGQSGRDLRMWFDRAVTAQLDFRKAYTAYVYAIYPRWGGSHEQILEWGKECAATNRYDTEVPHHFILAIQSILSDSSGDWGIWRQPGILEQASEVLSKYGETTKDENVRRHYYSELAGFAWQSGHYDMGRAALDKISGKTEIAGLNYAKTIPSRTVSGTYALTGSRAQKLLGIEKTIAAGQFDDGLSTLKAMRSEIKSGDPEETWIRGRAQEVAWQRDFENGNVVDLISQSGETWGWYGEGSDVSIKDGALVVTTGTGGARLFCGTKFGQRWEMKATFEVLPGKDGKVAKRASAGLFFASPSASEYYGLEILPGSQQSHFHKEGDPDFVGRMTLRQTTRFTVRMWDGKALLMMDDFAFMKNGTLREIARRRDARIGVFSQFAPEGTKFKITNFTIRMLTVEPPLQ